jgi:hypothetical protein
MESYLVITNALSLSAVWTVKEMQWDIKYVKKDTLITGE